MDLIKEAARIVAEYVKKNPTPVSEMPALISNTYQALAQAGAPMQAGTGMESEKREPAVPIRKSITETQVTCLDCGKTFKMLKRHLSVDHDLTPDEYRARWGLGADYPLVAPNYAERRSELAHRIGLGTRRTAAGRAAKPERMDQPEPTDQPKQMEQPKPTDQPKQMEQHESMKKPEPMERPGERMADESRPAGTPGTPSPRSTKTLTLTSRRPAPAEPAASETAKDQALAAKDEAAKGRGHQTPLDQPGFARPEPDRGEAPTPMTHRYPPSRWSKPSDN